MSTNSNNTNLTYEKIYTAVRCIPKGYVATYGQIAALIGMPHHSRQIGYALAALQRNKKNNVPWHRVVNAKGEISKRTSTSECENIQRVLLEKEGIVFDTKERISLSKFRWLIK